MATEDELRKIAIPLCRVAHGDCVMDEDDRTPCTLQNCRMMKAAKLTVDAVSLGMHPRTR